MIEQGRDFICEWSEISNCWQWEGIGDYAGKFGVNGFNYENECAENAISVLGGAEDRPLGALAEILGLL